MSFLEECNPITLKAKPAFDASNAPQNDLPLYGCMLSRKAWFHVCRYIITPALMHSKKERTATTTDSKYISGHMFMLSCMTLRNQQSTTTPYHDDSAAPAFPNRSGHHAFRAASQSSRVTQYPSWTCFIHARFGGPICVEDKARHCSKLNAAQSGGEWWHMATQPPKHATREVRLHTSCHHSKNTLVTSDNNTLYGVANVKGSWIENFRVTALRKGVLKPPRWMEGRTTQLQDMAFSWLQDSIDWMVSLGQCPGHSMTLGDVRIRGRENLKVWARDLLGKMHTDCATFSIPNL